MLQGLANGINSALESVKSAITSAGEQTIQWFRDVLGIRSPSKVFYKLGYAIPQGAQRGILGGGPLVNEAMAALIATTLSGGPFMAQAHILATATPTSASYANSPAFPSTRGDRGRGQRSPVIIQRGAFENAFRIEIKNGDDPSAVIRELEKRGPELIASWLGLLAEEEGDNGADTDMA